MKHYENTHKIRLFSTREVDFLPRFAQNLASFDLQDSHCVCCGRTRLVTTYENHLRHFVDESHVASFLDAKLQARVKILGPSSLSFSGVFQWEEASVQVCTTGHVGVSCDDDDRTTWMVVR